MPFAELGAVQLAFLALLGALISLAELGIAQSEGRQTVGVLKSRFRCTTSHGNAPFEQ